MSLMASQITSLAIVYSTVYSGADQRKHQCPASLAFVRGIHNWPVNSPQKRPVTRKSVSIWWRHHVISTCTHFLHGYPGYVKIRHYSPKSTEIYSMEVTGSLDGFHYKPDGPITYKRIHTGRPPMYPRPQNMSTKYRMTYLSQSGNDYGIREINHIWHSINCEIITGLQKSF